jgi:diguanylate cyclase (GGDEF)-like protein
LIPNRFRKKHKGHRKQFHNNPLQRPMGINKSMELVGVRKNGSEFPVEISLSPLASTVDEGAIAAIRDITERKMIETRQAILYETLRAVGKHLDVIAIVKSAVESIAHLSPWTSVAISLQNQDGKTWRTVAGSGKTVGQFGQSRSIDQGVIGRTYRTGQTQNVPDIYVDPDYFQGTGTSSQSELAVPIKHHETVIGVLNIESDQLNDFSARDISLAESLVDAISLAIANAYQYAETQSELNERKRTAEILRRQKDYLETLHQISLDLLNQRNVDDLLNAIINNATRLLDAPYGDLDIVEGDVMITKAYTENQNFERDLRTPRGQAGAASWQAYDTRQVVLIDDYATWPYRHPAFDVIPLHATIIVPLISGDECLGVFSLARSEPGHPFTPDEVQLTTLFAQQAALALNNAQLHDALHQESIRDPLTGLFNRRFMEESLTKELSRAQRKSLPLVIVIFDLDHLKDINDTFGHSAGDDALRNLSLLLKARIRAGDIACRYGGDEFVVILPESQLDDVYQRMEGLRKDIKQSTLRHGETTISSLAISVGIAEYPRHGSTFETLLKAADQALYRAKNNGRDQVCKAE